jgi:competence ComEA-like helix-hairpin-helix protein
VSVAIGKYLALAAASLSLGLATAHAHEPWITLPDCRYVANLSNDGDSFHVRAGRKEYIFRLYFVDAAETETDLSERTEEQAQYFGIPPPLTLKVGEAAKEFTRKKLQQPFTVRTCRQDALGRSKRERFYAFVQVGKKDLGEELVANGLARLHGTPSQAPGLDSPEREWEKLRRLEHEARTQKVGGWGANYGRLNAQIQATPEKPEDSFEAFFHPRRVAPVPISTATTPLDNSGAKLDVNITTESELDHLPGIGAVLAARIIAARPFKSADDLRHVKGIGEKTYEKIRPHFN